MSFDNKKILTIIVAITLLLSPLVAFTTGPLRIAVGVLFVIFFPGYTLLSALFPKRDDLGGIERIALSFGLSVAVTPLIGLILNYTPWGITLYPVLISITIFIIATSVIGWYRQHRLAVAERLAVTFKSGLPGWATMTRFDRGLTISLIATVVIALGCLGYAVAVPKQGERFTEFYIMGSEGKADDYPRQVLIGDPIDIIIGVVNHEHQPTSYRVKITLGGIEKSEIDMGILTHEEKREERVNFVPQEIGRNQKVEFHLYKDNEGTLYFEDTIHLYVDVVTFRVLDAEVKALKYQQMVGQAKFVNVTIGIVNNEHRSTNYQVKIMTNNILDKKINTELLDCRDRWRKKLAL